MQSCLIFYIKELFVTLGVFTGIGVGLSTTPGVILTARYFDKRRGLANAFCLSGTAAGSFTLPFLIEYLLEEYGFRGTMLVLGSCMLHILVSSALYRPPAVHVKIVQRDRLRKQYLQDQKCSDCTDHNRRHMNKDISQNINNQENIPCHPMPW